MPVQLTEDGESAAVISYVGGEAPVAEFGASELRSYVEAMSGAALPVEDIHRETPVSEHPNLASAVVVYPATEGAAGAENDFLPSGSAIADRLPDSDDAFAVVATDRVVIAGTTHRGTLYGVYELLERLGVGFFAPGFEFYEGHHESVPQRETIRVPDLDVVDAPDLTYRRKAVEVGWSATTESLRALVDWMAKARLNVLACPADFSNIDRGLVTWDRWREALTPELRKRGLLVEVGGHGFDSFLPPEEHEDRPEWFHEEHNVFDATATAAVETYVANVVEYLAERPEIDIFDAWPPDGASWPPEVVDAFGSVPNAYAHVVNALDDAVQDAFDDRSVTVEAIAYSSHIDPPDPEYMYDDSVLVDFAPIERGYGRPIGDPDSEANREYADLLETWRDAFDGPLVAYEYYRRYAWHSVPVLFPRTIGDDLAYYDAIGVDGLGMYAEPADWLTYELTHSQVAAASWDATLDVDRWVDDFLAARYGVAADDVAEYVEHVGRATRQRLEPGRVNESEDRSELRGAVTSYRKAREAARRAADAAETGSAAHHRCRLLSASAEYAVVDTELLLAEREGDEAAADAARERVRELAERHAFDGIVMHSQWTLDRYDESESAGLGMTDAERALFDLYEDE